MIEKTKVNKFIKQLERLITKLERSKEPAILQKVNETYYKQKCTELKFLLKQFEETEKKLEKISSLINEEYHIAFSTMADRHWISTTVHVQHSKAVL